MVVTDNEFKVLEERVKKLEDFIFRKKEVHKTEIQKDKKSLQDFIIELRNSGFFSQPKISQEVHTEIIASYPCELNRVEVALVRLADKKQLRKSSKIISDKKFKAYVWSK